MIEYTSGDILNSRAEALVNTVNCVGIMGRGIALQFKKAFPDNFTAYASACKEGKIQPGRMFVFDTGRLVPPRFVINFPTKRHWRGKSRIEDIELGLRHLVEIIRAKNIRSVAVPPLGSGLGGLDWKDVRSRIDAVLSVLPDVHVFVYEPTGGPGHEAMVRIRDVPKMTAGRAALVALMHRYLAGLLDPFVSLLEVHKLMYFMQEAGEPLRLKYVRGTYGPYAENLRHVLHAIEGHFSAGYADGGDAPDKPLSLVPGAVQDAERFLEGHRSTRDRLTRVSELVSGFESPDGLELLATVHWVAKHESILRPDELVARIHAWSTRKRRFTARQIGIAYKVLKNRNWLPDLPLEQDEEQSKPRVE